MELFQVWYAKPQFSRDLSWSANEFDRLILDDIMKTHEPVRCIEADELEEVWRRQQAEFWSPNGEARPLIEGLGLHHTSMSVGDVIESRKAISWSLVSGSGSSARTKAQRLRCGN